MTAVQKIKPAKSNSGKAIKESVKQWMALDEDKKEISTVQKSIKKKLREEHQILGSAFDEFIRKSKMEPDTLAEHEAVVDQISFAFD